MSSPEKSPGATNEEKVISSTSDEKVDEKPQIDYESLFLSRYTSADPDYAKTEQGFDPPICQYQWPINRGGGGGGGGGFQGNRGGNRGNWRGGNNQWRGNQGNRGNWRGNQGNRDDQGGWRKRRLDDENRFERRN
ncbi:unnamed protein product, partial [Mesorhabditis belari]|uniref:Uncharacterized protein n=1 Tax=Mesorhabditis belari TaxID=2138241 RepID=A0AAF3FLH2_9BILA